MIAIGKRDQRVTIQAKNATRAANGEEVVTWTDVATVWAKVEQLRGREYFAGAQMQDVVDVRVCMLHRDDVTRDQRLLWDSAPLDIVSIIEKGRKEELEIMCLSGVRNG